MKRLLSLIIAAAMLLGIGITALADAPADFTDVAEDAWYRKDVLSARDLGLMEGIGGGKFDPDSNLSIAQAVTLAARARSIYLNDGEKFERHDEWYAVYADYAVENGFLDPVPETEDDWNAPATRDFCASLFVAAMPAEALEPINDVADGAIPDVDKDDEAVYVLYRAGVMIGDQSHYFHPNDAIKRCEIAAVVNRLLKSGDRGTVDLPVTPPDAEITDPPVAPIVNE